MVKKNQSPTSIKTFLFTVNTSETNFLLLDKIRLMTLYIITLAALFGGIANMIILLKDEDPLSAYILLGALLFMVAGIALFWWKRDIKIIQSLFFIALLVIITDVIVEAGNRYGLGTFYIFSLLSISYLLLNQSYGIFLPLYFFIGMMIRLTLGNYSADSIFNNPDIISRFILILSLHVFLVIMAGVLLDYIIEHLYHLAMYDQVTLLPNRGKFMEVMKEQKSVCSKKNKTFVLLGVKMVSFSRLSPHLSQEKGDALLKETGRRISQILSTASINSRWSGSLFLSILEGIPKERVMDLSHELLEILKLPFSVESRKYKLEFIIGITEFPEDTKNGGSLVENILSLVQQRQKQENQVHIFDSEQLKNTQKRIQLSEALKKADLDTEFHLIYQPIISLKNNKCTGAEVLLRWTHPVKGPIEPEDFIPLAEENGIIHAISRWLIKRVLKDISQLRQQTEDQDILISVNLSIQDLKEQDFTSFVKKLFTQYQIPVRMVQFEFTEKVLMDENPPIKENLNALSTLGFRLSIDDFGTGYSSLGYLQRFPLDSIKIDKSFTSQIKSIPKKNYPVIDAIISLGHALGIKVIAEGVETEEQAQYLSAKHCQFSQGWLYSKGLPLSSFIASLQKNKKNP